MDGLLFVRFRDMIAPKEQNTVKVIVDRYGALHNQLQELKAKVEMLKVALKEECLLEGVSQLEGYAYAISLIERNGPCIVDRKKLVKLYGLDTLKEQEVIKDGEKQLVMNVSPLIIGGSK